MKNQKETKNVKNKVSFGSAVLTRVIYPASLIYTAFTMLFYLFGSLFDLETRHMVLSRKSGVLLFVFALITALANIVLTEKKLKLHISLRVTIHYFAMLLSFYVLFLNISGYDAGKSSTIILLAAFTVLYFTVCGIVFALLGAKKKARSDASEYKSIYN